MSDPTLENVLNNQPVFVRNVEIYGILLVMQFASLGRLDIIKVGSIVYNIEFYQKNVESLF